MIQVVDWKNTKRCYIRGIIEIAEEENAQEPEKAIEQQIQQVAEQRVLPENIEKLVTLWKKQVEQ